ncbi:hypothetical protein [Parvibium lacunae]|uniref:hypothetical protein n=1 Tax=Parvibium lacunae TaxID=1888893 RepID=UPI0011C07968|nr:hypothetical protein [Parvibium lacunae]
MTMKRLYSLAIIAIATFIQGCGGGAGASGGSSSSGSTGTVASVGTISISSTTGNLKANTLSGATLTVQAKTAGGVPVAGATMTISLSCNVSGGLCADLTASSSKTDTDGKVTATILPGTNISGRTITITASSGSVSANTAIVVSGAELKATRQNAGLAQAGVSENITFTLTDPNGNAIASQDLEIFKDGVVQTGTYTTSSTGAYTYSFTPAAGATNVVIDARVKSSPTVRLAAALTIDVSTTANAAVTLTGSQSPLPDSTPAELVGTAANLTVDAKCGATTSTNPAITFTTTSTLGVVATTGSRTATIVSSQSGFATVRTSVVYPVGSCAIGSPSAQTTVVVDKVIYFQNPVSSASQLALQATPTLVGTNQTVNLTATNKSTLIASVTTLTNSPVRGVTVEFSFVVDGSGGLLSSQTAITDAAGNATIDFIAGSVATSSNGVRIAARTVATPAAPATPALGPSTASLTVGGSSLFVTIGTGNTIIELDSVTYSKPFTVVVRDVAGQPVQNSAITIQLVPVSFIEGTLFYNGTVWTYQTSITCPNEDLDNDGVRDPGETGSGILRPGIVPAVQYVSGNTTNALGQVNFNLIYPQSYAPWANYSIRAAAIVAASGANGLSSYTYLLLGSADDFSSATTPPASVRSPYGTDLSCNTNDG